MASVYDQLMEDAPYGEWKKFALAMFREYGQDISEVADLGCGTGEFTLKLAREGYQLYGLDNSAEMLTYARGKTENKNSSVQWLQKDLRELAGLQSIDCAVSFCDVINYITSEKELHQVFQGVYQMLKPGGLFLFDVHSLNHVEEDLIGQTFAEIYDDISCVWFCDSGEEEGEVIHDLTFFVLDSETNQYERFDEKHCQRTYSTSVYQALLAQVGFQVSGVFGDFSINPGSVNSNTERIFIACKKTRRLS